MSRRWWALLGLMVYPSLAVAQGGRPPVHPPVRPPTPPRQTVAPGAAARDTTARDSTGADSLAADSAHAPAQLVQWNAPDSAMQALLGSQGYTITRYQGAEVVFNATDRELKVSGEAAVQHQQSLLVADTIRYNDGSKTLHAEVVPGDSLVLRDPEQGSGDIVMRGPLTYDLADKHGTGARINTVSAQGGQTWYLRGERAGFTADSSANGHAVFSAINGTITSDSTPEPDYHFQAGEMKMISRSLMVARPVVLYLQDIPILWLPFIAQDMRSGRHSGILRPFFGVSDIVRTSSGFRREIRNLGYYFALNDYTDLELAFDWRSSNGADDAEERNPFGLSDPGWVHYRAVWQYRWLNRFIGGNVTAQYGTQSDGSTNLQLTWQHSQQFSKNSQVSANLSYVSNTRVQQQQAFTVAQALAAIASTLNFSQKLGPASMSIGGSRHQYSGRTEVDQTFPTFTLTTKPIELAPWLVWSPNFSLTNQQAFDVDQAGAQFGFRYRRVDGMLDSTKVKRDTRMSSITFDTPLRIFDFQWRNSFRVSDNEIDFPQLFTIVDVRDSSKHSQRVFARTFRTDIDWDTGINLPSLSQGKWNISPSVSIVNVDPHAYWVRSIYSNGAFVHQSKRLQYGLGIAPTFFGLFPGFGPFSRIRHSIQPSLTYTYSPAGSVSDAYLTALGVSRATYLGALPQSRLTLNLNQTIEAKLKSASDTANGGKKIKLLSINFSPISWDFERARVTHSSGFATPNFSYSLSSDLLPGFDLRVGYSLFQGDVLSDTAKFKPFRETVSASFSIGRDQNPFTAIKQLLGGGPSGDSASGPTQSLDTDSGSFIPGSAYAGREIGGQGQGWRATFNYSSSRQRPIVGGTVVTVDPQQLCEDRFSDPILVNVCVRQAQQQEESNAGLPTTVAGGPVVRFPARSTLRGNVSFNLTPRWAVQWGSGYDFVTHEFSDHNVTLQRKFRSWLANFAFTSAPNGNFAFSFNISLKAAPELRFPYNRRTYRPDGD